MNAIRLLCVFLSFLAGWALPSPSVAQEQKTTNDMKFKSNDLRLPETKKIAIVSCYGKKKSVFSRETAETVSREDISAPIQEKTDIFVSNFAEAMVEAGFDVTISTLPAGCRVKSDAEGRITMVVGFTLIGQLMGAAEDFIFADIWLMEPSAEHLVGVTRKVMNGVFTQRDDPKSSAKEITPIVIKRIKLAQAPIIAAVE